MEDREIFYQSSNLIIFIGQGWSQTINFKFPQSSVISIFQQKENHFLKCLIRKL